MTSSANDGCFTFSASQRTLASAFSSHVMGCVRLKKLTCAYMMRCLTNAAVAGTHS